MQVANGADFGVFAQASSWPGSATAPGAELPDLAGLAGRRMRRNVALMGIFALYMSVLVSQPAACDEGEGTRLFSAVAESDCAAIGSLLDDGANVSARDEIGATPLIRALEKNLPRDCVLALLQAGADPNATHGSLQISVLMVAASYSTADVVSLLLESGAKVAFATSDGWTALMSAARNSSRPAVVRELVAAGADINARDHYGVTPLMRAVQANGNYEIIETLVHLGAGPGIVTPEGYTAHDLARSAGLGPEVLALLAKGQPKQAAFP